MNRYLLTSLFAILFYSTGITQPNSPVLIEPPNGASCNQTPETGWCDCGNSLNGGGNGDVLTTYEIQISDDGHFNNGHIVLDVPNYLLTHLRVPDGTIDIHTIYYWTVRMTNF